MLYRTAHAVPLGAIIEMDQAALDDFAFCPQSGLSVTAHLLSRRLLPPLDVEPLSTRLDSQSTLLQKGR